MQMPAAPQRGFTPSTSSAPVAVMPEDGVNTWTQASRGGQRVGQDARAGSGSGDPHTAAPPVPLNSRTCVRPREPSCTTRAVGAAGVTAVWPAGGGACLDEHRDRGLSLVRRKTGTRIWLEEPSRRRVCVTNTHRQWSATQSHAPIRAAGARPAGGDFRWWPRTPTTAGSGRDRTRRRRWMGRRGAVSSRAASAAARA